MKPCRRSVLCCAHAAIWAAAAQAADVYRPADTIVRATQSRRISSQEARTWTGTNGKTIEGWLVGADSVQASIMGKTLATISLANLSPQDVQYIESIRQSLRTEEQALTAAAPAWRTDLAALANHLTGRLKNVPKPGNDATVRTVPVGPPAFDKLRIGGNQVPVERQTWTLGVNYRDDGRREISLGTKRNEGPTLSEGFSIWTPMPDDIIRIIRPLLGEQVTLEMEYRGKRPFKGSGNPLDELKKKRFDPESVAAVARRVPGQGLQLEFDRAQGLENLVKSDPGVFKGPYPLVEFDVTTTESRSSAWREIKTGTRIKCLGIITGVIGGVVTKNYPNNNSANYWWMAVTIEDAAPFPP